MINRMGFNNRGQAAALARLEGRDRRKGLVGVNIGANKDSADRDRRLCGGRAARCSASPTISRVNISSPNTPGLRALQDEGALDAICSPP